MNSQLKKGILELVILELLKNNQMYGYQVSSYLNSHVDVKESSVYIILSRMQQNGYLKTTKGINGKKIVKYYSITELGLIYLNDLNVEFEKLNNVINITKNYKSEE